MSNIVANKQKFSVKINTETYQTLIRNTLGDENRAKRFVATITSAVAVNPALQECEAGSILAGALLGESLNLSPSPQLGQFYLVPFEVKVKDANGKVMYQTDENGEKLTDSKGRWVPVTITKAQFVLGYKGYIQMALRSGMYKRLNVVEIKQGEFVSFDRFTEKLVCYWLPDSEERDALPTIGYAATYEYLTGYTKTIYWSKEKMLAHADKYSAAFSAEAYKKIQAGEVPDNEMWKFSSLWYKDFDAMAKKTMLRQIIGKWGVMTTEISTGYVNDARVVAIDKNGEFLPGELPSNEAAGSVTEIAAGEPIKPEAKDVVQKINLNDV